MAITPANVVTGTWNTATRTFTPGGSSPNAVRVVAAKSGGEATRLNFASVLGFTIDEIAAETVAGRLAGTSASTAATDRMRGYGFFGRDSLSLQSSTRVFLSGTAGKAYVGTNGNATVSGGTSKVNGEIHYRGTLTGGSGSGTASLQMASSVSFAAVPTAPSGTTAVGNANLYGGVVDVPPGNLHATSASISNCTLNIYGPTTLYVDYNISLNNVTINVPGNDASLFKIHQRYASTLSISGGTIRSEIYAPNSPLTLTNSTYHGRGVFKSVSATGSTIYVQPDGNEPAETSTGTPAGDVCIFR